MKIPLWQAMDDAEQEATPGPVVPVRLCDDDGKPITMRSRMWHYTESCIVEGPRDEFFLVSGEDDNGGCDLCHTGNGPRSKENAVLFALSRNHIRKLLRLWEVIRRMKKPKWDVGGECYFPRMLDEDHLFKALAALDIEVERP